MSKLYPCVYCTEDGYCKKYSDDEVTSWCVQSPCKDEKPSNADRIRSMTDEELAQFIWDAMDMICPNNCYEDPERLCAVCILDYLKQEATND